MSEEYVEEENKTDSSEFRLKLGDIIEIYSPKNDVLNEQSFFIEYINDVRMVLINIATMDQIQLNVDEITHELTDKSIIEIRLLSRSEESGYAKQNQLVPGTWIEIHIGGDISAILTGEITSLQEDQIEIRTVPEMDVIYIDFEYKGIPEYIPIKKIVVRDKPATYESIKSAATFDEAPPSKMGDEPRIEFLETGEMLIYADEDAEEDENILDVLRSEVAKSKIVILGEELDSVVQYTEIPESKKKYSIELQTTNLLDELLSTIPSIQRNRNTLLKIHTLIAHYRELRQMYSIFNDNGDVLKLKRNNPLTHKPIVQSLDQLDTKIDWILPVVSLKKKIFLKEDEKETISSDDDVVSILFDEVLNEEEKTKQNTYYNDRTVMDENKYYKLYQQLEEYMRPFENPAENPHFLMSKEVRTSMEAIVDNLDDFYSSIFKLSNQSQGMALRKYVIQKYDLGLNRRKIQMRGDREVVETTPLTRADTMTIKSLVLLPAPVVNYSRVHLPSTSILEKSNLHMFPLMMFKILHQNKNIPPVIIDDLDKDMYEDTENEAEFLSEVKHYVLSESLRGVHPSFEKILQAIIPKTKTLIKLIKKYVANKLSFVSVVQALEPFKIYTDDISYSQYLQIRRFIIEQIEIKKGVLDKKRKEYGFLPNYRFNVKPDPLSVLKYLMENTEFVERMFSGYQLPPREFVQKYLTTSEILVRMFHTDNGALLTKLVGLLMSSLLTPVDLSSLFAEEKDAGDIRATDCSRRVLTKRYSSVVELHKDNDTDDVFYDKEFDDTPYSLLQKYSDERKKMLPDKFIRYLIENLVEQHDCPKDNAESLAYALLAGKKRVKEGEYAMLVIKPTISNPMDGKALSMKQRKQMEDEANIRAKTTYYYRKNNRWIQYTDIDEDAFVDTTQLFCNYKDKCNTVQTDVGEMCLTGEDAALRMRNIAKKKIKGEFNKRVDLSFDDMKSEMETQVNDQLVYIQRLHRILTVQREKPNNIAYQIGLEAQGYSDVVVSGYIGLRDRILGQTDFVKKQNDIVRFYDRFCREPMDILTEDHGWKYCKETNTKLLPAFLYELALSFVRGEDYQLRLEEMCHTHGLLSDAGNAIVDKNSGFTVRAIDFAEEDGYDEAGFKITSHAFIEKTDVEKVVENLLKTYSSNENTMCENERNQMICNLLDALSKQIPLMTAKDYCLNVANTLCDKMIDTEEKYNREAKKVQEKKGIKLPPYIKRKNQLTILITAAVFFTAIQTEVPSFQTKKTMPGCVKSFRGYPLDGEEDLSGIQYMACVLSKMEKKIEPWNAIEKMTVAMIQGQLKQILAVAIQQPEVDGKYLTKREYLLIHYEENIPVEHSIEKWFHFLPPLIDYKIKIQPAASDFNASFISLMKKGQKQQHDDFMVLKSKIAGFSYRIIENIQAIVQNKELLLTAGSTGKPFLQNVCCNEKDKDYIPMLYFARENDEILKDMTTVQSLSGVVQNVRIISKAPILYDPRNSYLKYPTLSHNITEENMYATMIHYCELDKNIRVPEKFHSFFTAIPAEYPHKGSMEEKIDFLKRNNKRFSPNEVYELLRIVHSENIVELKKSAKHNVSEILKDILTLFGEHKSPVIDKVLRERLFDVLTQYDKTTLMTLLEDSDPKITESGKTRIKSTKLLKNGLSQILEETFKPSVISFLKKYGKLSSKDLNILTQFFDSFVKVWATPDLYKVSHFIKNAVDEMTRIFPNILITNTKNTTAIRSYWDLSPIDSAKIFRSIQNYYEPLGEFRQDNVIRELLVFIQPKFVDLRLFFENIPIQESIRVGSHDYFSLFDTDTIHLLLEYIFLSVLHEYIIATDDMNLIRIDKKERKQFNRNEILKKEEDEIESEYPELSEEYQEVYGDIDEVEIEAGNRDDLKNRVAKMLLSFINIIRKNKSEIDISYETIRMSIRKRKENEKNRIVERFKAMSPDERSVEDMKKKFKMDEWNLGTQKGIFQYDKKTSEREVREQEAEEQLDIQKHGVRKADFISIHADSEDTTDILRDMVDSEDLVADVDAPELENEITGLTGLKNNFFDGQFYSDDESDDDFGDD